MTTSEAAARRAAATRAFVLYFALFFVVVLTLSGCVAYALISARAQEAESRAIRLEYCSELEKLKAENREDVRADQRHYRRNLRLLGIKDSPELRKAARESWAHKLARNAPKACPYRAG